MTAKDNLKTSEKLHQIGRGVLIKNPSKYIKAMKRRANYLEDKLTNTSRKSPAFSFIFEELSATYWFMAQYSVSQAVDLGIQTTRYRQIYEHLKGQNDQS